MEICPAAMAARKGSEYVSGCQKLVRTFRPASRMALAAPPMSEVIWCLLNIYSTAWLSLTTYPSNP